MSSGMAVPELKEILGALIFGAGRPLSVKDLRRCLQEVAETQGQETAAFAAVKESAMLLRKTWGENIIGTGGIGLAVSLVMLPIILFYTAFVYWTFRGKLMEGEGYH